MQRSQRIFMFFDSPDLQWLIRTNCETRGTVLWKDQYERTKVALVLNTFWDIGK